VPPNPEKRPLVITILAVIGFLLGGLCFLGGVLIAVLSYMITQRRELANAFSGLSVPLYGFKLGFADLAAVEFVLAIYAIVQGYGLWKLKTWGWWLYIIADIITLVLTAFDVSLFNSSRNNWLMLIGVSVNLVILWYFVTRRDHFNVKLPIIRRKSSAS
jgi:hypothetical protein